MALMSVGSTQINKGGIVRKNLHDGICKQISVKMARAAIKVVSDLPDSYLGFYFGIKAL